MAAAHFAPVTYSIAAFRNIAVPWLAGIVITFSMLIFARAIVIAMADAKINARARTLADSILK